MQQHARRSGGSLRPPLRLFFFVLLAATACGSCANGKGPQRPGDPRQFTHVVSAFGARFRIVFYAPDPAAAKAASEATSSRLADLSTKLKL